MQVGESEARNAGLTGGPQQPAWKALESQPPNPLPSSHRRRKHPLSSQENFTRQFRKPSPSPWWTISSLYFLPSLLQSPPHTVRAGD